MSSRVCSVRRLRVHGLTIALCLCPQTALSLRAARRVSPARAPGAPWTVLVGSSPPCIHHPCVRPPARPRRLHPPPSHGFSAAASASASGPPGPILSASPPPRPSPRALGPCKCLSPQLALPYGALVAGTGGRGPPRPELRGVLASGTRGPSRGGRGWGHLRPWLPRRRAAWAPGGSPQAGHGGRGQEGQLWAQTGGWEGPLSLTYSVLCQLLARERVSLPLAAKTAPQVPPSPPAFYLFLIYFY